VTHAASLLSRADLVQTDLSSFPDTVARLAPARTLAQTGVSVDVVRGAAP
jgi:hypothetical protein